MAANSTNCSDDLQPFFPELMMGRAELSKVRRLLRRQQQLFEQFVANYMLPMRQRQGDGPALDNERESVRIAIDELVAKVWKREVGLERFSVVRARREDAEFQFQVLSFSVRDGLPHEYRWMWQFEGRALRKDGTLGFNSGGVGFRIARLERRHLDGAWRELRWLTEDAV